MEISPELLQHIGSALRSLRYGTVQITVHNARVVQIDKVERVRFSPTTTDLTRGLQVSTPPIPHRTPGGHRSDGQ